MGGLRTRKYASLKVCRRCGWGDCAPASTPVSRYVGDVDGGTAHPQVRQSQGMLEMWMGGLHTYEYICLKSNILKNMKIY